MLPTWKWTNFKLPFASGALADHEAARCQPATFAVLVIEILLAEGATGPTVTPIKGKPRSKPSRNPGEATPMPSKAARN
eukprot:4797691-Amphidinium_carterae.3